MNRLNPYLFLMAFMFSFVFAACGSDDDDNGEDPVDNENPVISITSPGEDETFNRAIDAFVVTGELTDNVALDTCFFSLTTDLKSSSSLKSIDDPQVWQPNPKGFELSGKSHSFSGEEVFGPIPDDAMEGTYTLNIEVIDAAGNSATESISFLIQAE
ncbi:MAG: DUF4625 domain-containing protein [Bacteroidota bacterium]